MRRLIGLPIAWLFLAVSPAFAQRVLPDSFAGWQSLRSSAFDPARMANIDNAAAAATPGEYGFESGESAWYSRGLDDLNVDSYRMKDPSGAYGLYTYLRAPGMTRADFTDHSSISRTRALILVGNLVLEIDGKNLPERAADLRTLVATVRPLVQEGALPTLWQYLPQRNLISQTDRYILGPQTLNQLFPGGLGDSLGFQNRAEAELAHYRLGGRDATLLLVELPTDQIAARQLAELEKNSHVNGPSPADGSPALFAKRSATLVAIVSGASSEAEANSLLRQIQLETDRMWNEPVLKPEPRIELMIEGSIVGAMTICVFALVAGLSFGGLRLVVKRVMPGKIFDTQRHLEVLQLGLGSKPINSDDFYGYSAPTAPGTAVDKNLPDRVAMRLFR